MFLKFLLFITGTPYVAYAGNGKYCVRARDFPLLGYVSKRNLEIRISCWEECMMSLEDANKLCADFKKVGSVVLD